MEKNKKKIMLTKNNRMTTKKIGVLKKHVGNIKHVKLNMNFFFFQAIESIKRLKIESIGYNVEGH